MNGRVEHLPLQASERASFHGDPALENALELATVNANPPRIGASLAPHDSGIDQAPHNRNDREFHTVNLVEGAKGEGSDLKNPNSKYGSVDDDIELGPKSEGRHVSNASKDDAADGEMVCRVCHLGLLTGNSESIELGCACKQDLALCHRDCAEEWFKIRGNTVCEICGETAKNVHIPEPVESTAAHLEADGARPNSYMAFVGVSTMLRLRYYWRRQLVRNVLLASLVVICTVPWLFRILKYNI